MLDYVVGRIATKSPHQVIVQVGGLGLDLKISLATYEQLPASGEIKLFTSLQWREEQLRLYGFASLAEREIFQVLQNVKGIGPALALAILSHSSPTALCQAISTGDVQFLKQIKGIGQKTAQRIVLELKDSLAKLGSRELPPGDVIADAFQALLALGFNREVAQKAIRKAWGELPADSTTAELVRRALQQVTSL